MPSSGTAPDRQPAMAAPGRGRTRAITSHDVAVHGLGIQRAQVIGQMLPGLVSVLVPEVAAPEAVGVPYVVFAGNVGDDDTLAHVVTVLRGTAY